MCYHVKHKKLPFLAVLTWFPILGKIQDRGQDGDHCWWRHRPPAAPLPKNIPQLVKKIKGFRLKVKSFRNTATDKKLRGGVPSTLSPPPTVGVWLCVYVRGLIRKTAMVQCYKLLSLYWACGLFSAMIEMTCHVNHYFDLWQVISLESRPLNFRVFIHAYSLQPQTYFR